MDAAERLPSRNFFVEPLKVRRSKLALFRWVKYPLLGLLSVSVLIMGLLSTQALQPTLVFGICGVFLAAYAALLYFSVLDWHDEIYEITADGTLSLRYKTVGRYRTRIAGPLDKYQWSQPIQRGIWQYLLNFGDLHIQVGWRREPFVMRDVFRPRKLQRAVVARVEQARTTVDIGYRALPRIREIYGEKDEYQET